MKRSVIDCFSRLFLGIIPWEREEREMENIIDDRENFNGKIFIAGVTFPRNGRAYDRRTLCVYFTRRHARPQLFCTLLSPLAWGGSFFYETRLDIRTRTNFFARFRMAGRPPADH